MAVTEKDSRYRWKNGKELELLSFVDDRTKAGATVTSALKEYSEKNGMSWLTARWKYYQVKRKMATTVDREGDAREDGERKAAETKQKSSLAGRDFLGALSEMIETSEELGEDVVSFIKGISRMASLAQKSLLLEKRLSEMEGEKNLLSEQLQKAKRAAREATDVLRDLDDFFQSWLSSSQVEKVSGLKDFVSQLESKRNSFSAIIERLSGV